MSDLAEFLLARIADDEEQARKRLHHAQQNDLTVRDPKHLGQFMPGWWEWREIETFARRVLAECEAKRRIVEAETQNAALAEWTPDCGGDWCLSGGATSDQLGVGYFANYWPDDTVSVSVYRDGEDVARSGIVARRSRAECQAFAEQWVRDNLAEASIVLRLLALPYAEHPDYRQEWRP